MDPKLSGALERIATIYVTYLITKYGAGLGFNAADVVVILMSGLSAGWGVYKNSKSMLLTVASEIPEVRKIELVPGAPETRALNESTPDKVITGG